MDTDEREICEYLKAWQEQFISAREICRRAGGKWRFREDANWALPVLSRLVEKRIVESDSGGHYRLVQQKKKNKSGWIAPHIKSILEKSGKDFTKIYDLGSLASEELEPLAPAQPAQPAQETVS